MDECVEAAADPVAGVDGCSAGWLLVTAHPGRFCAASARIVRNFEAAFDATKACAAVLVDMPVGLLDEPERGGREADRAARGILSERNTQGRPGVGSRVFNPSSRRALKMRCDPYEKINAEFPRGLRLSKQTYHLMGKIAEVDDALGPDDQTRVREGHPELSFARLIGETAAPKRKGEGADARRSALWRLGFDRAKFAEPLGPQQGRWAPHDLLDACALCACAACAAAGRAARLPPDPPRDRRGLAMEMWF